MYSKIFDVDFQAKALEKRRALTEVQKAEEERELAELAAEEAKLGWHDEPVAPVKKKLTKKQAAEAAVRAAAREQRLVKRDADEAAVRAGKAQEARSLAKAAAGLGPSVQADPSDPKYTGKRVRGSAGGAGTGPKRARAGGAAAGPAESDAEEEADEEMEAPAAGPAPRREHRGDDSGEEEAAPRPYDGHELVLSEERDLNKLWVAFGSHKATGRKQQGEPQWVRTKKKFFELLDQVILLYQERLEEEEDDERTTARLAAYTRLKVRLGATEEPGAVNFDHAFTEELNTRASR